MKERLYWWGMDVWCWLQLEILSPIEAWWYWGRHEWWRVHVLHRDPYRLTVRDYQRRLAARQERLRALEAVHAPACIIEKSQEMVDQAHAELEAMDE